MVRWRGLPGRWPSGIGYLSEAWRGRSTCAARRAFVPSLTSLAAEKPAVPDAVGTVNLSVIVPTYNRGPALSETIEFLLRQDPAPREIIVVDQSTDHDP